MTLLNFISVLFTSFCVYYPLGGTSTNHLARRTEVPTQPLVRASLSTQTSVFYHYALTLRMTPFLSPEPSCEPSFYAETISRWMLAPPSHWISIGNLSVSQIILLGLPMTPSHSIPFQHVGVSNANLLMMSSSVPWISSMTCSVLLI